MCIRDRGRRAYLNQADIQKAFVKVGIGTEKKSKVISEKEKRITAYHEAGHGILFHEMCIRDRQLEEEEARTKEIEDLQDYVKSDEYMEKVAKEKIGLLKPNEIIFKEEN